jgi:hypothetical protein
VLGSVRELREGVDGARTLLGYSFIVKENGGRAIITPSQGVTQACVAHAINHTCRSDFANCKLLHTGITNDLQEVGGTEERL